MFHIIKYCIQWHFLASPEIRIAKCSLSGRCTHPFASGTQRISKNSAFRAEYHSVAHTPHREGVWTVYYGTAVTRNTCLAVQLASGIQCMPYTRTRARPVHREWSTARWGSTTTRILSTARWGNRRNWPWSGPAPSCFAIIPARCRKRTRTTEPRQRTATGRTLVCISGENRCPSICSVNGKFLE